MKFKLLGTLTNSKLWIATFFLQINPINNFITKWLIGDLTFLKWLVIAMILDLITGIAKVIKNQGWKAITSSGLRDTISKCIQYGSFLIITHVLTHFSIAGEIQMGDMTWLSKIAYEFVILIEIKSVYENIVAIDSKLDFIGQIIEDLSTYFKRNKK